MHSAHNTSNIKTNTNDDEDDDDDTTQRTKKTEHRTKTIYTGALP